jgi:two-component system, chemotaxis family, chemotaxis protein CheY
MKRDILVVDDDPDLRDTLLILLKDRGFAVRAAANGRAALEQINAERPCLILLDLMMPEMNGWQFIEHVRQDPSLSSIPIVIMTAHKSNGLPALPAEDVLHKPFDVAKLLATIERHAR